MTNVVQLRPQGKPGQTLPPLNKRGTRVLLLASSYHDACESVEREHSRSGKPGSRLLVRSALWREGSYDDLEHLLDELRHYDRVLYGRFWRQHVGQRFPNGQPLDTHSQRRDAGYGLVWITRRMPASIYVPPDVSEAAGYMPGDAKAFSRPKKGAA